MDAANADVVDTDAGVRLVEEERQTCLEWGERNAKRARRVMSLFCRYEMMMMPMMGVGIDAGGVLQARPLQ